MNQELSQYINGTRTATVYARTNGGYRIVMIDSYFETEGVTFARTEDEADNIAEDWVMQNDAV
jgi:hypothetical protein